MPRLEIDYSKTIIYKLCCLDNNVTDIYIGHTTDFRKRKTQHKSGCTSETGKKYNIKVYKFIRENGGWDNWKMIQVEEYPCKTKRDAEAREQYWMQELNPTLNSVLAFLPDDTDMQKYHREHKQNDTAKLYRKSDKYKEYRRNLARKKYKKRTTRILLNELRCYNL